MKPFYSIQNAAGANASHARLEIFDEIGPWGVTAKDFSADLKTVTAKDIDLYLNTIGGDVFAGLGIYNLLQGIKAQGIKVHVKVLALAASIGSVIAMAGDDIEMPENSFMMIHNPWTFAMGNSDELRDTADVLDKIGSQLTAIYVKRTGMEEEPLKALLAKDTYLTAAECLENGFCDKLTETVEMNAKFDIDDLPAPIKAAFKSAKKPEPPKAKTEPPVNDLDEPVSAADITPMAKAAGLEAYATAFALDNTLDTKAKVQGAFKQANETIALCKLAGKPDEAKAMIEARSTLADVRAKLITLRAADDKITNTQRKTPNPDNALQALSPAAIYKARAAA